jgi:hypothetical protein
MLNLASESVCGAELPHAEGWLEGEYRSWFEDGRLKRERSYSKGTARGDGRQW